LLERRQRSNIANAPGWLPAAAEMRRRYATSPEWRADRDASANVTAAWHGSRAICCASIDPFVTLGLPQSRNATHCTPPLPAADIERIVNSIAGKELRGAAMTDNIVRLADLQDAGSPGHPEDALALAPPAACRDSRYVAAGTPPPHTTARAGASTPRCTPSTGRGRSAGSCAPNATGPPP
jgi:hypothetical protein